LLHDIDALVIDESLLLAILTVAQLHQKLVMIASAATLLTHDANVPHYGLTWQPPHNWWECLMVPIINHLIL
jgi:hypothetical protein